MPSSSVRPSPRVHGARARASLALALGLALAACASRGTPSTASPSAENSSSGASSGSEAERWRQEAARVTIVRDDHGIAHIHGHTDADAVFGLIYAQAEDDFNRVETNYLNSMGRLAEAEGERAVYQDLRMKLFIDPDSMRAKYAASPRWLTSLMDAWADGLNFYLSTHPAVTPRVIRRFEPWMALTFSEGSIGGDVEDVSLRDLEAFYGKSGAARTGRGPSTVPDAALRVADRPVERPRYVEPTGSNGMAIAPSNTVNHRALLLINPHTSFFFRSEVKVESDEGLNAYGAVTWGQFFVYQGFNDRLGWMHTSSGTDRTDEFAETVAPKGDGYVYQVGGESRPVAASTIAVPYRAASGAMATRTFTVYRTHHGPIVRAADGKWIAISLMQRPIEALQQSYLRTKARDYAAYMKVGALQANSSNNTIYADADGHIAYMHPQFIPRRNDRSDYTHPVDGSDPANDWHGLHAPDETPHLLDPPNGWIANSNNWPYSAAGEYSPKRADYPRYMDVVGENPRGIHYTRVLSGRKDFSIPALIGAAYDPYLPAFAQLVPPLLAAYDSMPASSPMRAPLAEQVAALRGWDYRWGVASVPTSLAVFWGEELWARSAADARRAGMNIYDYMATRTPAALKLAALGAASDRLTTSFGTWRTPWGDINRFQRITGDIVQPFDDAKPSIPMGFTSAQWGSLASFGARTYPGTKKYYGTSGNSFVAVVEFGPDSVHARAVTAGGESGDPASPHFNDQALRYSTGDLREVYFYASQLAGHTERAYRPGM